MIKIGFIELSQIFLSLLDQARVRSQVPSAEPVNVVRFFILFFKVESHIPLLINNDCELTGSEPDGDSGCCNKQFQSNRYLS